MEAIGLVDVHYLRENGYLVGTLPATSTELTRKIGFIAHMDTADFNAEGVNPQVIDYTGGDIALGDSGFVLSPTDFPALDGYVGQTLVTTDGTTLLGADDKAGIAEIMTAMAYLAEHPEIPHGEIRVGFGPDEEIGVGADKFDVEDFDVDFAYTVDGGPLGELQYETFSAAGLELTFLGRNVHPGTAKNQMVNALQLAIDFHNQLPEADRPELTDGYQGFFHLSSLEGTVEEARSAYIIRDFEDEDFKKRKELVETIANKMNANFDTERVKVNLYDGSYHPVDSSEASFKSATAIALKKGVLDASPVLLEPIDTVTVAAPEYYVGGIMGSLNSKRARILGTETGDKGQMVVRAEVPEAELYQYATDLRSQTQGRGTYEREFLRYEVVPEKQAAAVIEEAKAAK